MEGNLSAYRIFYMAAQKGNISYAAKELYISQPAISKAISKLEENLGVSLFYRSSRGVTLTEEGKILYEHTRNAFEALEEGEADIKRIRTLGIGQIRIGVSTTLCKYILIPYLKRFIEKYPHIKVIIHCQSTFHTIKLLEENKIDIGLIGRPLYGKELEFYRVQEIEDIFVAGKNYMKNLALRETVMGKDILKVSNLMLLDGENISRHYIDVYFKENQIETNQVLEVGSMDLLIEFAKIGLGVACVIKEFVEEELEKGVLMEVDMEKRMEKREIGFSYSKRACHSGGVERFLSFIQS